MLSKGHTEKKPRRKINIDLSRLDSNLNINKSDFEFPVFLKYHSWWFYMLNMFRRFRDLILYHWFHVSFPNVHLCKMANSFITGGKSLLESWCTTLLLDWQPPLIFVWFISNFLCVCSDSMASAHVIFRQIRQRLMGAVSREGCNP